MISRRITFTFAVLASAAILSIGSVSAADRVEIDLDASGEITKVDSSSLEAQRQLAQQQRELRLIMQQTIDQQQAENEELRNKLSEATGDGSVSIRRAKKSKSSSSSSDSFEEEFEFFNPVVPVVPNVPVTNIPVQNVPLADLSRGGVLSCGQATGASDSEDFDDIFGFEFEEDSSRSGKRQLGGTRRGKKRSEGRSRGEGRGKGGSSSEEAEEFLFISNPIPPAFTPFTSFFTATTAAEINAALIPLGLTSLQGPEICIALAVEAAGIDTAAVTGTTATLAPTTTPIPPMTPAPTATPVSDGTNSLVVSDGVTTAPGFALTVAQDAACFSALTVLSGSEQLAATQYCANLCGPTFPTQYALTVPGVTMAATFTAQCVEAVSAVL